MAGLDPATQLASVSERRESLGALTCAGWVAASRAAMVRWGYALPASDDKPEISAPSVASAAFHLASQSVPKMIF